MLFHHIEHHIKSPENIAEELRRRVHEATIHNIYAHIYDVAGVRVIRKAPEYEG